MDLATPRNVRLSAFYRRSNALPNTVDRMPETLAEIIENIKIQAECVYDTLGEEGLEDFHKVMLSMAQLQEDLVNDNPFRKLKSHGPDVEFYNYYLEQVTSTDCTPTFQATHRLYAECYMYRRIWEAFELTDTLRTFDPFCAQKEEQFYLSMPVCSRTGKYLNNILKDENANDKEDFIKLAKLNLWSNKCDLSLPSFRHSGPESMSTFLNVALYDSNIICNQLEDVWNVIRDNFEPKIIDFVADNCGYELFVDLCLADFLLSRNYVNCIRFHVKIFPWFISDANEKDVLWMVEELKRSSKTHMKHIGERWDDHLKQGRWQIMNKKFWVLPIDFAQMPRVDPWLYKQLQQSKLVIVKGDLNFRKLVGDLNWAPCTPFRKAMQNFRPTNIFAMRVLKSDIICGLPEGVPEKMNLMNDDWMLSAKYATLQFARKRTVKCECAEV